jgi:hypothetical protein
MHHPQPGKDGATVRWRAFGLAGSVSGDSSTVRMRLVVG